MLHCTFYCQLIEQRNTENLQFLKYLENQLNSSKMLGSLCYTVLFTVESTMIEQRNTENLQFLKNLKSHENPLKCLVRCVTLYFLLSSQLIERRNTENLQFLKCRANWTPLWHNLILFCYITHDMFNYILMRMLIIF